MTGDAGQRFDIISVDLVQLGDPVKNAIQLAGKLVLTILGNIDPREAGDSATVLLSTDMVLCFLLLQVNHGCIYHRIWRSASLTICRRRFPAASGSSDSMSARRPSALRFPMPRLLWQAPENPLAQEIHPDAEAMFSLCDAEGVGGMIIGWPVNMDGSEGPRCDATRDFAHALLRMRDLPIAFQDERLSTQAVESAMLSADMTRQRRAERRDALAAGWILQSALDRLDALRDMPQG